MSPQRPCTQKSPNNQLFWKKKKRGITRSSRIVAFPPPLIEDPPVQSAKTFLKKNSVKFFQLAFFEIFQVFSQKFRKKQIHFLS